MSKSPSNLRINGDRLWDSLMEMVKIGPGVAGGNNRQTLTDEDGEARALLQKWCEQAGYTLGICLQGVKGLNQVRCQFTWALIFIPSQRATNMMVWR